MAHACKMRIIIIISRIVSQCIFPRSQHSCLYYIYILTKSEFISSYSQPAVGSNIVQITNQTLFVNFFFKWPKITLYRISYHFRSIPQFLFLWNFCTKWLPPAILDVRNSLSIAFQAIFIFFFNFWQNGWRQPFWCPKLTFDRISGHFRSIRNFIFLGNFWQNGCRWPFWMSEIHFGSHFWPF